MREDRIVLAQDEAVIETVTFEEPPAGGPEKSRSPPIPLLEIPSETGGKDEGRLPLVVQPAGREICGRDGATLSALQSHDGGVWLYDDVLLQQRSGRRDPIVVLHESVGIDPDNLVAIGRKA